MSVEVLRAVAALRARCDEARARGARVGFVPTMGALHDGHIALAREARARVGPSGLVATSIFVNPTQFAPSEDLSKYPRTLDADLARCAEAGVDVVFAPAVDEMYPDGDQTRVRVAEVSAPLEGEFRPTHFEGVATVVTRLFNAAGPCVAVFGRKDYQQLRVITRMVRDLMIPVEVVGHRTIREADGLAMSSPQPLPERGDRARAAQIRGAARRPSRVGGVGERGVRALRGRETRCAARSTRWTTSPCAARRICLRCPRRCPRGRRAVLALAVRVGATRLIDNAVLGEDRVWTHILPRILLPEALRSTHRQESA
ncbi:MAG: pantoate--beta-alanine ligase [Polyangiales bacterium]